MDVFVMLLDEEWTLVIDDGSKGRFTDVMETGILKECK